MKILLISLISLFLTPVLAKQVPIDKEGSLIRWVGQKKVPGGAHNGTVKVQKGTININEKSKLVGGSIVIDMTSIEDKDLSGKWKKQLEDHLNSVDFFDVANNKEASFKITKVEPTRSNLFKVTGNLTLRGKTNQESFEIKIEKKTEKAKDGKKHSYYHATGTLKFNRTQYGVNFRSEESFLKNAAKFTKDKIISNDIQLTLDLKTQAI